MTKSKRLQWSFAGGEMSPEMFGHAEDGSFQIGVAKAQNFVVKPSGAMHRRPGTKYRGNCHNEPSPSELIPFVYSPTDAMIIELAEGVIRFFDDDGIVQAFSGTPTAFRYAQTSLSSTSTTITFGSNSFALGERLRVYSSFGTLVAGVDYFVVASTSTTIQISTVLGGPALTNLTAAVGVFLRRYWTGEVVSEGGINYYCLENHENITPPNAIYWHPLTHTYVEIPHKYLQQHLSEIQFAQSADILTLVHPMYPPAELRRYGRAVWRLRDIEFGSEIGAPIVLDPIRTYGRLFNVVAISTQSLSTPGVSTSVLHFAAPHEFADGDGVYLSQDLGAITAGEWIASNTTLGYGSYGAGQSIALKNPTTNAYSGVGSYSSGRTVRYFPISTDTTNTYAVTAVDKRGVESSPDIPGVVTNRGVAEDNILYVAGAYNTVRWTPVAGAERYHVYKEQNGLLGYIGQVDHTGLALYSFDDDNIAPDLGITPPINDDAISVRSKDSLTVASNTIEWQGHGLIENDPVWFTSVSGPTQITAYTRYYVHETSLTYSTFRIKATLTGAAMALTNGTVTGYIGDFPGAVAYFEQRRVFAGSRSVPQGVWMTRTGTESDIRYSLPVRDTDRISVVISARQASTIKHVVPMDHLLMLATSAEYRVTPLNDDALTPKSISVRPQTYIGSSGVRPIVANNTVVFCAARGGHVREMGYQAAAQGFTTGDLSLRAAHLFDDYEILRADQMKAPHSILWFVSSSGQLLSLTYIPEESVGAWSWHDTYDTDSFTSVAVIPAGDEDSVWVVVNRDGTYRVENMAPQAVTTRTAAKFVDSYYTATGVTLSAGDTFPVAGQHIDHLAGRSVAILIDGVVYPNQMVTAIPESRITMPVAVSGGTVTVGLPYTSELQTMPFTSQVEAFAQGMPKNVNEVWVRVYESAPFEAGPDTSNLSPSDPYDETAGTLKSGEVDITLLGKWSEDGQVVIRQTDPLPLTVVSLTARVTTGGN